MPVPTIKYYLREGLLPAGESTAATQARYDDTHVRRLLLVRALADVGELPLASIRRIMHALDDETTDVHKLLGIAQYALGPRPDPDAATAQEWKEVSAEVDDFLVERGWRVTPEAPARTQLITAILALRRLGFSRSAHDLTPYADAAQAVANYEVNSLGSEASRTEAVKRAVIMTVLYEPILLAFRHLAQESESARRFADPHAPADA